MSADNDPSELTTEDVRRLSMLARVGATDEDLERMRGELAGILENFRVLQEVDTEGVEPTGHAIAVENVFRPDEPHPSSPRGDVLQNAPSSQEGYVRVRGVFDD